MDARFGGLDYAVPAFYLGARNGNGRFAMDQQGAGGKPGHAFTPHMTLLYDQRRLPLQPVQPLRWHVGEFLLVRSFLGQTRYQLEGRWQLG